jgi:hypothetical protein
MDEPESAVRARRLRAPLPDTDLTQLSSAELSRRIVTAQRDLTALSRRFARNGAASATVIAAVGELGRLLCEEDRRNGINLRGPGE